MLKRLRRGLDAWGHYLLALLCAGTILLSAAWTREQSTLENTEQQALSDLSQRLAQAAPSGDEETFGRPTKGEALRGYSEETVYFPQLRLWRTHRATDFAAAEGDSVLAVADGTVISCGNGTVRLRHENGLESLYQGLKQIGVINGQSLRRGAVIGLAGGRVPYEGTGHICVALLENGVPIPCRFAD